MFTLLRLGWSPQSARHLAIHDGTKLDLLGVSPQTVGFWVDQVTLVWSDSSAHSGTSKAHFSARQSDPYSRLVEWRADRHGTSMCWSSWRLHGVWTQHRLSRLRGLGGQSLPAREGPGRRFRCCYESLALQKERDMRVSQSCGRPRASRASTQGTVCTWLLPLSLINPASRCTPACLPSFCGITVIQRGSCRGTSSQTGRLRALGFAADWLGCGGFRRNG